MNKTVFLDRDGVINYDKGYVYKIEDFVFKPGVLEALKTINEKGYQIIIVTNQSGIARGYFTEEDYFELTDYYLSILKKEGVEIKKVYHCPHYQGGIVSRYSIDCNCRKPRFGLFEKAVLECDVDVNNAYAVGDNVRDLRVCDKYKNVKGIIVENKIDGFTCFNSLLEFAKWL